MHKLSNVQRIVDLSWFNSLRHQEFVIRGELENILYHEEILWKQKLRCEWLKLGDRNTSYFHIRTLQRRKFNKITALRGAYGNWVFDQDTLKSEAVNFFQKLYGEDPSSVGNLPRSAFPGLNSEDVDFLEQNVTNEEIKVQNPDNFSQLRPISLCSVLYKLVMKIIANRFKIIFSKIISQEQAGFIAGRSIINNVIIAQEVLHSMRVKKSLQWMAIKIDLEKAYDRVRWDFVEASLIAVGIPSHSVKVIMNAIMLSSMQVLWNGVPTQKFKPIRGIRQGCPLFSYFFVLWMEWLGHRFHGSILVREWSPIRLSCSKLSLLHLFFADDLVIFSRADVVHSGLLTKFLSNFCKISGHKVNARKTNVFFSTGVNISSRNEINDILGFQKVNDLGHYLGVPLFHRRVTKSILDFLVDGVRSRLSSWDAKSLSFTGRVTLAQSILLSIPRYFIQSSLVPKGVFAAIEGLTRQFIWGTVEGKSKIALVKWEDLCQPKINGGLGFR
ncbi:hypothetical protein PVK06_020124 [Gossypium arboreum]|uniref:Reverse transcriptase domain-containing protein n=1 Tax=Gossypium arboreum TaxID=29729 RepID=A0ABR0PLK7_GOSAR|nr:hypothetical protein PVK06_020124 [Gossypium arboreum]